MVMTFGNIFYEFSDVIVDILFVGNWPEKHASLWQGHFFKMIFSPIWDQIRIRLKKLSTQTAFIFFKSLLEVGQICKKKPQKWG